MNEAPGPQNKTSGVGFVCGCPYLPWAPKAAVGAKEKETKPTAYKTESNAKAAIDA